MPSEYGKFEIKSAADPEQDYNGFAAREDILERRLGPIPSQYEECSK
jgi:hypothetical protein